MTFFLYFRLLAQTSPENTTAKNFSLDPQSRYKNLNLRDSRILQEIKHQVRHLIIDKNDFDIKNYANSYEAKRSRRATVGINPDDVIKAKHMSYQPLNAFDDFNKISPAFSDKYKVPSLSIAKNPILNCDNQPIEVIELKPKNSSPSHIDFKPRNNEISSLSKKNYQARNHFLDSNINQSEINKSDFNKENYSSQPDKKSHFSSCKNLSTKDGQKDRNNFFISNLDDFLSAKTNLKRQDYKHFSSHKHDSDLIQNHKYKKSLDIVEKAQHLEQKFEDQKKPYVPKLLKVGKIEEEDWNVKMWNSSDIFG